MGASHRIALYLQDEAAGITLYFKNLEADRHTCLSPSFSSTRSSCFDFAQQGERREWNGFRGL